MAAQVPARQPSQNEEDAALLAASLGPLPPPRPQPALVVLVGLPGSGKSHFCLQLMAAIPLVRLESDALRRRIFPEPTYSEPENQRLFTAVYNLVDRLLASRCSLVLDATNLRERYRQRLYEIAERRGVRLLLVRMWAPPALIRRRLEERQEARHPEDHSEADYDVYLRMRRRVDPIRRPHITVDTSQDVGGIIRLLAREVAERDEQP